MDKAIETGPARADPFALFRRRRRRWLGLGLLLPIVPALGQDAALIVRVEGPDALYGFTSTTPSLNFAIATVGNSGTTPPITVPAGRHELVADDPSGVGLVFSGVDCSSPAGRAQADGRTLDIDLAPGGQVDCVYRASLSPVRSAELMSGFLSAQGNLLITTLPGSQSRIDRLNGAVALAPSPQPFMESLPGLVAGGPIPVAGSLAALDRLAGDEQQRDFDAWVEGTFGLFGPPPPQDRFAVLAMGSDYRISRDLLVGGFLELDAVARSPIDQHIAMSSSGWTAGGYATARLTDNLYFDVIGGGGQSANLVGVDGGTKEPVDASRYLLSASLSGNWAYENWTFTPQAKVSYVEEAANGNSVGAQMLPMRTGMGQIAVGPGVSYRMTTPQKVVIETGLRLDTGFNLVTVGDGPGLNGHWARVEGTIHLTLPQGAQLGTSLGYDGIGSGQRVFSAKGKLSMPLR